MFGQVMKIVIWNGQNFFPYHFNEHPEHNLEVDFRLLDKHEHSDYNTRDGLLDEIWDFLKDKSL